MSETPKPPRGKGRASAVPAADSLYERYKDALRRGHVAALRGRNDAAIDAYGEAASIAPDRALPHASIGGILVKMDRLDDATAAYDRALALAPRDETALRGRADVLVRTGRRTEAAATLDRLTEALDAGGRLADATDAARRALELAESRDRRRQLEGLADRLRASSGDDETARRALEAVLRLLEPAGQEPEAVAEGAPEASAAAVAEGRAETEAGIAEERAETEAGIAEGHAPAPASEAESPAQGAAQGEAGEAHEVVPAGSAEAAAAGAEPSTPSGAAAAGAEPLAEPEPEPGPETTAEPAGLGIALGAAAEAALYAGDLASAHDGLLAAARAHRRAGRVVAAVDACYLAIGLAPADPELHLLLVELYLDRGWRTEATDKLLLLGRLAELDGDRAARDRLCAIATARLADEPRLVELCA